MLHEQNKPKKLKKYQLIYNKLNGLNINESFDINQFIFDVWNLKNINDIYFQRRSFDVLLTKQRKLIFEESEKTFKIIKGNTGIITRIT